MDWLYWAANACVYAVAGSMFAAGLTPPGLILLMFALGMSLSPILDRIDRRKE